MSVAVPARDDQVRPIFLRTAGELAQQRGLAAARFAHHQGHLPSTGKCPFQVAAQTRQLALAGDKVGVLRFRRFRGTGNGGKAGRDLEPFSPVRGRRGNGGRGRLFRRGQTLGPDALVQGPRLLRRENVQFRLQNPRAGTVLAQGCAAAPGSGIELHQVAMRGLAQRIQFQPAPRPSDRPFVCSPGAVRAGQSLQHVSEPIPQRLGLVELPLVERRAVAEGEPGHKAAAVQPHRLLQEGQGVLRWSRTVRTARPLPVAKDIHVQPDIGIWVQSRGLPVDGQPSLAQGPVDHREGAPQLSPGAALVERRPEQRGQRVAAVITLGDDQVGEKGERLATGEAHRFAVQLESRWAK